MVNYSNNPCTKTHSSFLPHLMQILQLKGTLQSFSMLFVGKYLYGNEIYLRQGKCRIIEVKNLID